MGKIRANNVLDMVHETYKEMFKEPLYMDALRTNPEIYHNEPYNPPETLQDVVNDYLNALNILRQEFLETENDDYARLLLDLVPAAIYSRIN
jgi:hypothetical protein